MSDAMAQQATSTRWWIGLTLIVAALVTARAFIGEGMGRVYVQDEQKAFVAETASAGEAAVWREVPMGTLDSVVISRSASRTPGEYRTAEAADPGQRSIVLSWPRTIGLWVAAFFTLAVLSFLIGDNPIYKFTECVVVGVSAAYWMVVGFWDTLVPQLLAKLAPGTIREWCTPGLEGDSTSWLLLVPLLLGAMLMAQLSSRARTVGLWPLAFVVGCFAGLKLVGHIESDVIEQCRATILPLMVCDDAGSFLLWESLRNALIVVGVLSSLAYFVFSIEHRGGFGKVARVGVWYLMITFGAAFGFTVMGRIALLAARFEFLFIDWLWLIDPKSERVSATVVSMLVG